MKRVEARSRADLSTYTEKQDIQDNHTSNVLTIDSLVAMTVVVRLTFLTSLKHVEMCSNYSGYILI